MPTFGVRINADHSKGCESCRDPYCAKCFENYLICDECDLEMGKKKIEGSDKVPSPSDL